MSREPGEVQSVNFSVPHSVGNRIPRHGSNTWNLNVAERRERWQIRRKVIQASQFAALRKTQRRIDQSRPKRDILERM